LYTTHTFFSSAINIESFTYLLFIVVLNNGKHHESPSALKNPIVLQTIHDNDLKGSNESNDDSTIF
jgi:hypothetical protein